MDNLHRPPFLSSPPRHHEEEEVNHPPPQPSLSGGVQMDHSSLLSHRIMFMHPQPARESWIRA